jgi:phage major head subunit gpT-like protein
MAISEQWPYLLEPGLRRIFFNQTMALAARSVRPLIFNVMTSQKAQEHFLGAGGMGDVPEYKGTIEYDDLEQLYKTTLTFKQWVKGFKIERQLVDDDMYNIINARPAQLAIAYERTKEKHAASVFNNAFSSSYVGGDSVALCSASHPYSPGNSAVQSNLGTSALSYDTVIATRKLMRAFEDDRGELMPVVPDLIVHPPELEDTANKIVNTANKPSTGDFEDNFVRRSNMKAMSWDYLTDSNNWFLIDSAMAALHLLWIDRVATEFAADPTGDFNLEGRYRGYARWAYGWSDWRFVYGHSVT